MVQLINKSALVTEIKIRIETYSKGYANGDDCRADALETFLHDIDTLEVKEVDLEKEATEFVQTKEFAESNESPVLLIAEHFFELGLKAQKGE